MNQEFINASISVKTEDRTLDIRFSLVDVLKSTPSHEKTNIKSMRCIGFVYDKEAPKNS